MRSLVALELGREMRFDNGARMRPVGGVGKLYADACLTVSGGALGRDPDHFAGDRETLFEFHHGKKQEDLVSEAKFLGAGHKKTAALNERHVGAVKGLPVLNGQGKYALLRHGSCLLRLTVQRQRGRQIFPLYQPIPQK